MDSVYSGFKLSNSELTNKKLKTKSLISMRFIIVFYLVN